LATRKEKKKWARSIIALTSIRNRRPSWLSNQAFAQSCHHLHLSSWTTTMSGGSRRCPLLLLGDAFQLEVGNEEGEEKKGEINHRSHLDSD
jgi:hypothetical protein